MVVLLEQSLESATWRCMPPRSLTRCVLEAFCKLQNPVSQATVPSTSSQAVC